MRKSLFFGVYLSLLSTLLIPSLAFACGGFFEEGPSPVNQAAEKIIFVKHNDGFVSAIVQVLFEGDASAFGWIIPVPGIPEIGVSSNTAFSRLQNATNPVYFMRVSVEGDCKAFNNGTENNGLRSFNNGTNNNGTINGPLVADAGNVGPYDFVVLEVPNPQADGAKRALDWLKANQYSAPEGSKELFQDYLDRGMNLLAFKLTKSADLGDIRPIVMKYESDKPMIPIKLTAVAANEDMGVLVWVLGDSQAITTNYKSLELNDSLLDWFTLSNYNRLVIRAANEAGGQGFITEMSEKTARLKEVVFSKEEAIGWADIMGTTYTEGNHLLSDIDGFVGDLGRSSCFNRPCTQVDGIAIAVENAFPRATRTQRKELEKCLSCFPDFPLEPSEFGRVKKAFDDWVVAPLADTQKLIDSQPYFTRLYTTMSAAEMTNDPLFEFTTLLDDVSNVHVADRVISCDPDTYIFDAAWDATLPSGLKVRGNSFSWPVSVYDDELPANLLVRENYALDDECCCR